MSDYTKIPPGSLQCNHCDLVMGDTLYPVRQMRQHIREDHAPAPTVWDSIQEPDPEEAASDWRQYREPISEWRGR